MLILFNIHPVILTHIQTHVHHINSQRYTYRRRRLNNFVDIRAMFVVIPRTKPTGDCLCRTAFPTSVSSYQVNNPIQSARDSGCSLPSVSPANPPDTRKATTSNYIDLNAQHPVFTWCVSVGDVWVAEGKTLHVSHR